MRVKLFVDFWNFQLTWNEFVGKNEKGDPIRIPWEKNLPKVVLSALSKKREEKVNYSGTQVYASVAPDGDAGLRRFLHTMDSFSGYDVLVKDRKLTTSDLRCTHCKENISLCPKCNQRLMRTIEKAIDSAVIIQMIQMAHDNIYDVAVLGSNDADLAPAVDFIQQRLGKHVYHLWFPGKGETLRNTCWDHLSMKEILKELGLIQER